MFSGAGSRKAKQRLEGRSFPLVAYCATSEKPEAPGRERAPRGGELFPALSAGLWLWMGFQARGSKRIPSAASSVAFLGKPAEQENAAPPTPTPGKHSRRNALKTLRPQEPHGFY